MSATSRASLFIMGLAAFMVSADARVIDPLLKIIAENFHSEVAKASIVISAYTLPYGLFQLFYGPLGDRIGKLRVMAITLALFAFGTAACALAPNLPVLFLLRFLTGVVAASIIPLSLGYIGDKFPYETRQVALGRFMSALMFGQIMSSSLGGIFGQYIGWSGIFLVFGVVALLVSIGLGREAKRFPEEQKSDRRFGKETLIPYRNLLTEPAARLVLIAVLIEGFFVFGGMAYLGASLRDRFHLRYDVIGLMLAAYGVGGLIYSVSVKKLVKSIGEMGILLLGGVLLSGSYIAIALITDWRLFIPFNMLLGMGFYTMHSTLQTKATEMAPKARGTAVSLFAFSLYMGQATGAPAIGRIVATQGYAMAFEVAGIGLLLLALWARYQFPKLKQEAPKPA